MSGFILLAALLLLASPCVHAKDSDVLCNLTEGSIDYQFQATGGLFEPGPGQYRVSVAGMKNVVVATKPLAVDFPESGGTVQFFYVNPPMDKDVDRLELVGCLKYVDEYGNSVVAHREFYNEGGVAPRIRAIFSVDLKRGMGNVLIVIQQRVNGKMNVWEVSFFSSSGVKNSKGHDGWGKNIFYAHDKKPLLEGRTLGGRDFPYKTKQDVIKGLVATGYMDRLKTPGATP